MHKQIQIVNQVKHCIMLVFQKLTGLFAHTHTRTHTNELRKTLKHHHCRQQHFARDILAALQLFCCFFVRKYRR